MEKIILNEGTPNVAEDNRRLDGRLRSELNRIKSEFFDLQRGKIDYAALKGSEAYARYVDEARLLQGFKPESLATLQQKKAFWVNLYNILVIHGAIELDIHESVKDISGFFEKIVYRIGEEIYSPDDIEHGILRGNRHPPHSIFAPFGSSDPRLRHIVDPTDPRIHFSLVCGSSSCPPINFYTPERIDEELDIAAAGFINGPEVEIDISQNLLRLSPIFKWYRSDFGGYDGVLNYLIRYTDHGGKKDFLIERGLAADVEWKEYDWSLNR